MWHIWQSTGNNGNKKNPEIATHEI